MKIFKKKPIPEKHLTVVPTRDYDDEYGSLRFWFKEMVMCLGNYPGNPTKIRFNHELNQLEFFTDACEWIAINNQGITKKYCDWTVEKLLLGESDEQ